jgi:hypothetical protein
VLYLDGANDEVVLILLLLLLLLLNFQVTCDCTSISGRYSTQPSVGLNLER